ncbi:unnamed protein product [Fraxinus pennsylvanica]|uniref:Translation elongation factor EF1B beta/delta subunit guanine nucleotide exchange domain-containing protein n=1 Tax=Fraxinus pennsylvanica TaxID=56036 RepID=A0AAD2A793_9LAMI|nr:unnamed protein product [Fraxinus pennsylvanica]
MDVVLRIRKENAVHFRGYPGNILTPCEDEDSVKWSFINALKEVRWESSVLLDVKPWDDEIDMKKLEKDVRSAELLGLLWGASKLVEVGYGIKKQQIMMTIVDDLVSVDDLIEERHNQAYQ